MNVGLKSYLESTKKPWGILFYKIVFKQLDWVKDMKVLDFGSGFSITANHFAKYNQVTAIEPNREIVSMINNNNEYTQIIGGINELRNIESNIFDIVICHNVLEYAGEREDIIKELSRVTKEGGHISIVKHNHVGRIMQKVVFENNVEEALKLLDGSDIEVMNFGKVSYYKDEDIIKWSNSLKIDKKYGIRTFWALQQNNEIKEAFDWQEGMFKIEMKVCEIEEYRRISFFNHIIFRKV